MPSCWVMKFSKKPKKKSNQDGIIVRNWKCIKPVSPQKHRNSIIPDKGFQDEAVSKTSATIRQVSHDDTFRKRPPAQPLPLPVSLSTEVSSGNNVDSAQTKTSVNKGSNSTLVLPIPINRRVKIVKPAVDCVSNSSESLSDPSGSCPISPPSSNCRSGIKSTSASPPRMKQVDQFLVAKRSNATEIPNSVSHERMHINSQVTRLHIPRKAALLSARDYSLTSPSKCPISQSGQDPRANNSLLVGDLSCPDNSPLGMTSPSSRSRIPSGTITPLHPGFGGSSTVQPDHVKQQSHRLPLPPLKIANPSPFSPSSTRTSPRTQIGSPSSPAYQWKKGRLLGSGTFGQVYIGFNSESGEMCAIKEVSLYSDDAKSKESALQLGQEIAFLSRLRHPNIVQYYGSATSDDKLYIFLEYVSGGSIHKILQEYGRLGEAAIQSYTQQILSGLAYLHARNTLHRDIKGANILVDPSGRVKLADFGMAKHITGQSSALSFKGSPYWMAPEVIKNSSSYNFAVDIWSLGCTILEMTTAKPPWSQYEGVAAMFKIGHSNELPAIPDHLSDEGKDFIMRCLQRNPRKRPTAVQLLEHPFIKSCASFERPILSCEPLEALTEDRISVRVPVHVSPYTMRNVSCPVSPVGSSVSHSRSPRYMSGRLSPSPLSSPRATSGFSAPSDHSNSSLPLHLQKNLLQKGGGASSGFQNAALGNGNCYQGHKIDIFRGIVKAHLETDPHKSDVLGYKSERVSGNQKEESYCEHVVLADQVSKQLLMNPLRLNPLLEVGTKSKPFNM